MTTAVPSRHGGRELTPLEIATGVVLGSDEAAPQLPAIPSDLDPLAAFEDVVRGALRRPPCVVTFSGGRDSSAVLAVAARIARDERLPAPVAVTLRFFDTPLRSRLLLQRRKTKPRRGQGRLNLGKS